MTFSEESIPDIKEDFAEDYLQGFGLQRDPFAQEVENDFYYNEATREQRLSLLLHLAPYGEVLLVSGVNGIGKTTLLQQFLARAKPTWWICQINAAADTDSDLLLQSLCKTFVQDGMPQDSSEEQINALREQFRALRHSAQSSILVIDDADLLSPSAFETLLRLINAENGEEKGLTVILFSSPTIDRILDSSGLQPLRSFISHTFDLLPFSEEDTAGYIKHRLNVAGLQAEDPFTPQVLKVIHGTSHGIPAQINELGQVVLRNSAGAMGGGLSPLPETPRSPKMPLNLNVRKYLPAALIAVIIIIGLAFQQQINRLFESPPQSVNDTVVSHPAPEFVPKQPPPSTQSPGSRATNAAKTAPMAEGTATNDERKSSAVNEQLSRPMVDPEPVAPAAESIGATTSTQAVTDGVEIGVIAQVKPPEIIAPVKPNHRIDPTAEADKASSKTSSISVKPAAPMTAPPEQTNNNEIKKLPPKPVMTQAPAAPAAVASKQLPTEAWLLAREATHYTMQIAAFADEQKTISFISDHNLKSGNDAAYFRTLSKGKTLYAITYGDFASQQQALAASKNLPPSFGKISPWVRSFGSIQGAIESFLARNP